MRILIFLAVLLAATTATASPTSQWQAYASPCFSMFPDVGACHLWMAALPKIVAEQSAPARKETPIERITRLRAERQGTTVLPRTNRFPHAPDARLRAKTIRDVLEDFNTVRCVRARVRKPHRLAAPLQQIEIIKDSTQR